MSAETLARPARLPTVLRWPGSKSQLAGRINALLPLRDLYLEPYAGSAAVLMARERSPIEILNDLDQDVLNFWTVVRTRPEELARAVALTPWSRQEYVDAREAAQEPVERARRFMIRSWQGHGFKRTGHSGWRRPLRVDRHLHIDDWLALPERIAPVAHRLRAVLLEQRDALRLIREYRSSDVVVYADPPYHPSVIPDPRYYVHLLDAGQHEELLDVLRDHPGPVVVSGYHCPAYDRALADWTVYEFPALANGRHPRIEVLWANGRCRRLDGGEGWA